MPEVLDPGAATAERIVTFLTTHRVRLIAAGVILVSVAVALWNGESVLWLLLLPIIIGASIPLASVNKNSDGIDAWRSFFARSLARAQQKKGAFAKYFQRPLHAGSLTLWVKTDPIADSHVRAGVRLGIVCYLWAVMALALVVAIYLIVGIVIVIAILAIISWFMSLNDSSSSTRDEGRAPRVPLRGVMHKGSSWLNEERASRVEADGTMYEGSGPFSETRVGRVDENGTIYSGASTFSDTKAGRVDDDGVIYDGASAFSEKRVGRVDKDGNVYDGTSVLDERRSGSIKDE